jgi:drug/metabolite transporter (DMT)-like permease
MDPSPTRGQIAVVLLLGLLWGLNWPTVKIALGEIGPWTLRASALSLAGISLACLSLLRGRRLWVRPDRWWRVALPGMLAIAAPNVLIAHAQLSAPTGRIAVVAFTMPVWAVIFARLFLREHFDRRRLIGLALGVTGLSALALPLWRSGEISVGLFLAFGAAICWAAGTVLVKRFPADSSPLAFATWQLLMSAVCILVGMLVFEGVPQLHTLRPSTLMAFAYHALLGQALATALWFEVLAKVPASMAALGTLTVPAVGVFTAMLLLGERPTLADLLGLAFILAAAATVLMPTRRDPALRRPV